MATKKTNTSNVGKIIGVTAGIAALSAAAYLLFGPEGKKNQKKAKAWMVRMKADIIEKMEKVEHVTAPVYQSIIDSVEKKYLALKNIDQAEVTKEIATLKKSWKKMIETPAKKKK